jgi:hypothetical protein
MQTVLHSKPPCCCWPMHCQSTQQWMLKRMLVKASRQVHMLLVSAAQPFRPYLSIKHCC